MSFIVTALKWTKSKKTTEHMPTNTYNTYNKPIC